MLSVKKCREILGHVSPESDADLELLRDQLYTLANASLEVFSSQNGRSVKSPEPASSFTAEVSEDERYEVEERAAILEFDGGVDRAIAQKLALRCYWRSKHEEN